MKYIKLFIQGIRDLLRPSKSVIDMLGQTPNKTIKEDGTNIKTKLDGQYLTKYEFKKMSTHKDGLLHCPDCDGKLAGGPEGGGSQNMACEQCFSEFNFHGCEAERISDKGPRSIGNRAWCYGFSNDTFFDELNTTLEELPNAP